MHPNDHDTAKRVVGRPPSLDNQRKRARRDHLLEVRAMLAVAAAERRSHGMDDADYVFGLMLRVESAICEEFPDVYDEQFADWTAQESQQHPVGRLTPGCEVCETLAAERGVNLLPPEAA